MGFFMLFVLIGLCGFHSFLVAIGQTTFEFIKPQNIEKYFKDEMKRKQKYLKSKKMAKEKPKMVVDNYTKPYTNYFDEDFVKNVWNFLSGTVHPQWMQPLECTVVSNKPNV